MILADILAARLGWEGTGYVLGGMSLLSPRHECCWLQLPHAGSFKGLSAHKILECSELERTHKDH